MRSLRYAMLLSLVVLLLASCAALPPVTAPGVGVPEVGAPTTEAPAVRAPEAAASPVVAATEVVTATAPAVAPTAVINATAPVTTTAPAQPAAGATPTNEQVMAANPLVGAVWEWAALIKTKPATQSVVPNPASYTVVFNSDGTLAIKADCNSASATYTLENDQLTIAPGPVTLMACQPGSQGEAMLRSLSNVASYLIDGGDLILRIKDTGDSMLFRNGGSSVAPPAELTPTPAPVPLATEAPAGAAAPGSPQLVGTAWQWEQLIDVATGKKNLDVNNPARYTVTFAADGKAALLADCNQTAATYKADGTKLTIEVGPVTLAACGAGSLTDTFLIDLTSAASYKLDGGKLLVDLMADGGRMVFGAAK